MDKQEQRYFDKKPPYFIDQHGYFRSTGSAVNGGYDPMEGANVVSARTKKKLYTHGIWEGRINDDTDMIILNVNIIRDHVWAEVNHQQLFVEKRRITLEQLKRAGWLLTLPE